MSVGLALTPVASSLTSTATERELKKVERELAELYKKSEVLEKFKASIEATHEEMDNLACKLDTIANIWGSVRLLLPVLAPGILTTFSH